MKTQCLLKLNEYHMTAWVAAVIVFPITDCGISHWADSERHPSLAKKEVSMNHFVTLGFVFLLASLALAVVLDADLAHLEQ